MAPYIAAFPVGTRVRVSSAATLTLFKTEWTFHHPLTDEQIHFADVETTVDDVSYYHGGDPLYQLAGIPGIWHEQCLLSVG